MSKWNERNWIEPIPPKLGARETPPIAPETPGAVPEGKSPNDLILTPHDKAMHSRVEPNKANRLKRTAAAAGIANELGRAFTFQPATETPARYEQSAPARNESSGELSESIHKASEQVIERAKKKDEAQQEMKKATKEDTDKMHKGEIRETPPTKPPEKPAEKATSEVSKAQAEKQRVLSPDAKVVRSTVEPPRPVHRAPGIKEVDFSSKPQETKKEGTGNDGKEDPTKHKFETPDQPKPKPTIQGPKM